MVSLSMKPWQVYTLRNKSVFVNAHRSTHEYRITDHILTEIYGGINRDRIIQQIFYKKEIDILGRNMMAVLVTSRYMEINV